MWKEAKAADGRTYYYDTVTNQTTWDKPADFDSNSNGADPATAAAWRKTINQADGRPYYYNSITKETTWTKPDGFQDEERPSDTGMAMVRHDTMQRARGAAAPWERDSAAGMRDDSNIGYRGVTAVKADETYDNPEEAFFSHLKRQGVTAESTWEEAVRLAAREKPWRAYPDARQRKLAFEKYKAAEMETYRRKEGDRARKFRADFLKALRGRDDIKHYTRWETAQQNLVREIAYKQARDDAERRAVFDEYMVEVKENHAREEAEEHSNANKALGSLLSVLLKDAEITFDDAQKILEANSQFTDDAQFKILSKTDVLNAFVAHVRELGQDKRSYRAQREARDDYKALLEEQREAGHLTASAKWQSFFPHVRDDPRYKNLIGNEGSSPVELFIDAVDDEKERLRPLTDLALDVLAEERWELTLEHTSEDFSAVMRGNSKTSTLSPSDVEQIYHKLLDKVKRRAEEEKLREERKHADMIDDLRTAIRELRPEVKITDKFETVMQRLESVPEYEALDDQARRTAFDKHIRRLQKDEEHEKERAARKEHRNGSRRSHDHDYDRDRDRRRRSRSPEENAYEADRRKAMADRERNFRKASFGLSPPPRDRHHSDGRSNRYDSVYERERRMRDQDRERNFMSRADPRDRGKVSTLDYGDEDTPAESPPATRKRRESEASLSKRDSKRVRRGTSGSANTGDVKMESVDNDKAMQSGSEEGSRSTKWFGISGYRPELKWLSIILISSSHSSTVYNSHCKREYTGQVDGQTASILSYYLSIVNLSRRLELQWVPMSIA